jgi:hypothetical protein
VHPHHLKCTCNLFFLKHNVANVECEITVIGERLTCTAMWDSVLKFRNAICHLLPRVTERHIKPSDQDTLKVSLAAQVLCSTVAAAISTLVTVGKDNCTEFEWCIGLAIVMLYGATIHILIFFYGTHLSWKYLSLFQYNAGYMDNRCLSTAAFVKEIDNLFDSLNGIAHNSNLKWALMQWKHPSSLRATKCEVCHYAWSLCHL